MAISDWCCCGLYALDFWPAAGGFKFPLHGKLHLSFLCIQEYNDYFHLYSSVKWFVSFSLLPSAAASLSVLSHFTLGNCNSWLHVEHQKLPTFYHHECSFTDRDVWCATTRIRLQQPTSMPSVTLWKADLSWHQWPSKQVVCWPGDSSPTLLSWYGMSHFSSPPFMLMYLF